MKLSKLFKASSIKTLIATSLSAALMCSATASAATSVWKVSKGNDYLYLGGTVHILPESAFPLPAEFEQAYKDTDTLVLEAKMPTTDDTSSQASMLQAMSYTDGKQLSDHLSPEVNQQLAEYFTQYGIQLSQLKNFKPGFIMLQIMAIEMQKAQITGIGVDSHFDKRAQQDNKAQLYLESLESQIHLLANMGQGYEDSVIKLSLEQSGHYKKYIDDIIAAWRVGDIASLENVLVAPIQDLDPQMYQDLLVKRNQAWLPKIEQMFGNEQRELVLVGAGHMAGQHSVIALLQAAGYQIEQVTAAGEQH